MLDTCDLAKNAIWADVQGDTAHMQVRFDLKGGSGDTDPEQDASLTLVRQDGSWRLDAVDDSALPFLPATGA